MANNKKIVNYEQLEKEERNNSNVFACCLAIFCYLVLSAVFTFSFPSETQITLVFWYSLMATAIILAYLADRAKGTVQRVLLLTLLIFFLSWFAGFRQDGTDDYTYRRIFVDPWSDYWSNADNCEIGYLWLNRIFRYFSTDFNLFRFFIASITIFCTIMAFWKHRTKASFPLCVLLFFTTTYYYLIMLNLTRIHLAASIAFFHFDLIERKKPIQFYIVILACVTIHKSSYFYLVFLPFGLKLDRFNLTYKKLLIFYLFYAAVMAVCIKFIIPALIPRYSLLGTTSNASGNMVYGYALFLVFACLGYRFVDKKYHDEVTMCIVAIVSFFIFGSDLILSGAGRLGVYCYTIIFLNLTVCYKQSNNYLYKYSLLVGLVIFAILYIYSTQFGHPSAAKVLIPYKNIFFTIP